METANEMRCIPSRDNVEPEEDAPTVNKLMSDIPSKTTHVMIGLYLMHVANIYLTVLEHYYFSYIELILKDLLKQLITP